MQNITSTINTSGGVARKWNPFRQDGTPIFYTTHITLCPSSTRKQQPTLVISTRNKLRLCTTCQGLTWGGVSSDEDEDDLCPVDCVREFKTDDEFLRILEKAKETKSLVVVDFYRSSCGSCKYIEQGFAKLCRGSGDEQASVIFLKHNVIDEYDEQSEVAERLRIRTVPLFHFYKDGALLEAFPTREKERITEAIRKYTSSTTENT